MIARLKEVKREKANANVPTSMEYSIRVIMIIKSSIETVNSNNQEIKTLLHYFHIQVFHKSKFAQIDASNDEHD